MTTPPDREFFIGYLPAPPPAYRRLVKPVVLVLLLAGVVVSAVLVVAQRPFPVATFEYGRPVELEGWIEERPYPTLLVPRPGETGRLGSASRYLLVGEGKHGAGSAVAGLDRQGVRLRATLIYRDDQTMLEVVAGSVDPLRTVLPDPPVDSLERLGRQTLAGEIVDAKCYLGVMNPGAGKTHRECAARCISGGVPPLFAVPGLDGATRYFLLVADQGGPVNRDVLDLVAEPIEITGWVERRGDVMTLRADPAGYRRL